MQSYLKKPSANVAVKTLVDVFVAKINAARPPDEQIDKYSDEGIEQLVQLAEKDELREQL